MTQRSVRRETLFPFRLAEMGCSVLSGMDQSGPIDHGMVEGSIRQREIVA